ncbi:retrotransposon protein, putative, unclassified [Senna tora]|uniref:Retrotransposon protein, putative, unclassified n=1 Tax=Senna tora TaxID=362788 RepID=A0A834TPB1_9FABA|nr:retrotransposon protein, putative, unclassified [Senna tora]
MVCGDLNKVLSRDEKWGGREAPASRIHDFKACLDECGLTDLGFIGWIQAKLISLPMSNSLQLAPKGQALSKKSLIEKKISPVPFKLLQSPMGGWLPSWVLPTLLEYSGIICYQRNSRHV